MFKNPIAPKKEKDGDYPFEFKAPPYDKRSSCFMSAGDDWGVGHRAPIGLERAGMKKSPIPQTVKMAKAKDVYGQEL